MLLTLGTRIYDDLGQGVLQLQISGYGRLIHEPPNEIESEQRVGYG